MKPILFVFFQLIFLQLAIAQTNQYTSAQDVDPEAKAIMDVVKKKYNGYRSIEAVFTIETRFSEEESSPVQEGRIARAGDKYFMVLGDFEVICNGEAIWYILKENEEVQINDIPEEEETGNILSPQSMFNFYTTDNYVYALTNELVENNQPIKQIEFKPLSRESDYFKLRLSLHSKTKDITKIEAFNKDGTRYIINVKKLEPNKNYLPSVFEFDQSKYPDFYVEDLRE